MPVGAMGNQHRVSHAASTRHDATMVLRSATVASNEVLRIAAFTTLHLSPSLATPTMLRVRVNLDL
jgi:hypothetical protein